LLTGAGYAPPGCGPPVTHTALELSLRSEGAFNESEIRSSKSHPFRDDKLRAALKYLSHRFDFQEGLGCHMYVEKALCESNNGFATKFKSGRKVAMCPGCLGPSGEQSAVDEQKTWSVRICDACKTDSPGGLLAYQGQAPRKRGAAADPTDDDEQPHVSTSQLIPGFVFQSSRDTHRAFLARI
jgi:hypothetical protein